MFATSWDILRESAIFILVGFAIAGLIEAWLRSERILRLLRGDRPRSVAWATLVGVPLPLCSCSVLPTAVTLRRKGASKGATLSFLISTPETSVTSILLTYALLGPLLAVVRPIAACITALTAGLAENWIGRRESPAPRPAPAETPGTTDTASCCDDRCARGLADTPDESAQQASDPQAGIPAEEESPRWQQIRAAWRYAFIDLFDDIFGWLMVGIAVAAAIQVFLPADVLQRILGGSLRSMVLMALIGVPLYVCAEASTPIAAALMLQGMNPGAALVLLLVGPATNIGSLGVLHQHLGRRTVIVYLASIVLVAMLLGGLLDAWTGHAPLDIAADPLETSLLPGWLETGAALAFLLIGLGSVKRLRYLRRAAGWLDARLPLPVSAPAVSIAIVALGIAAYLLAG